MVNVIDNGIGYWIKFDSAFMSKIEGIAFMDDTLTVKTGWNLIGSTYLSQKVSSITTEPPNIILTPFYGYDNSYSSSDTLKRNKGYWIKVSQAGKLIFSNGLDTIQK
jgi:hypothetical protein